MLFEHLGLLYGFCLVTPVGGVWDQLTAERVFIGFLPLSSTQTP